jgi:hypothetical protein
MSELRPPAEVAYLVEVLGLDATLDLMEKRGGTRLYVPRHFDPSMDLAQEFGAVAARALVARWGDGVNALKVPLCKWWRARIYGERGMSYPAIALALGCSETSVWRYLQPDRADRAQLDLFRLRESL